MTNMLRVAFSAGALFIASVAGCEALMQDPEAPAKIESSTQAVGAVVPFPFGYIITLGGAIGAHLVRSRQLKRDHLSTIAGVAGLVEKGLLDLSKPETKAVLKAAHTPGAEKLVNKFNTNKSL